MSSSDLAGLAAVVSGATCVGAGIYLLNWDSAEPGTSWFEAIAHGLGGYMVGKGVFVGMVLWLWQRRLAGEEEEKKLRATASEPAAPPVP